MNYDACIGLKFIRFTKYIACVRGVYFLKESNDTLYETRL